MKKKIDRNITSVLWILFAFTALLTGCVPMPEEPQNNKPPTIPQFSVSSHYIIPHESVEMSLKSNDMEADRLAYQVELVNLEDNKQAPKLTNWTSFFPNNKLITLRLAWSGGLYSIRVRCKDERSLVSEFSDTLQVYFDSIPPTITASISESHSCPCVVDFTIKSADNEYYAWDFNIDIDADGAHPLYYTEDTYQGQYYQVISIRFEEFNLYNIRAQAIYTNHMTSKWSDPLPFFVIPSSKDSLRVNRKNIHSG